MYGQHTPLRQALRRPWPGTRRGLCLWLFAISFIVIGVSNYVITIPPAPTLKSLSFPFHIAGPHVWGWVMISCGAAAVYSSYCHFGRDRYGFTLLATFCGGWGLAYLCGYFFYEAGPRAIAGSVIWFLFSGAMILIAGFPSLPFEMKVTGIIIKKRGDD